jgi:hypothetical protein
VFSSHFLQGKPREVRQIASLFTESGTEKKIMTVSLHYQVPGAIGINQHYCKIDISQVPPPSLSPPLVIATKVFVVLLGMVASRGVMLQCISQPGSITQESKHINAVCAYTSFVKQQRT